MRLLLGMLLGAGGLWLYQKHVGTTQANDLLSAMNIKQNTDGSFSMTFPDGSTANIDAAAMQWMQTLAPQASGAATASATSAAAAPASTSMGALRLPVRRGGPVRKRVYLPA